MRVLNGLGASVSFNRKKESKKERKGERKKRDIERHLEANLPRRVWVPPELDETHQSIWVVMVYSGYKRTL